MPSDKTVVIDLTSYMEYYCVKIFNTDGEEIWYTDKNEWNSRAGYRRDMNNLVLSAGTYYMQVNGYMYGTWYKTTGKYVFTLTDLNQSNCAHEYEDKTISPTYFKKGYVLHKCKKCGKSYKDQCRAKKTLNKGRISTYSHSGKGKIYLQWYTAPDASGYQIRYSRKKSMKKGVKTKKIKGRKKYKSTIKKLSRNKKYYVQVRAYKKSGKKIVYGKWSAKKCLKTR